MSKKAIHDVRTPQGLAKAFESMAKTITSADPRVQRELRAGYRFAALCIRTVGDTLEYPKTLLKAEPCGAITLN